MATYTYRVTKQHMSNDGAIRGGTSITLGISLDIEVYENYLDVGFARNFASSQAYAEKYHNNPRVIPSENVSGLKFKKVPGDVYEWLGFEAYDLIFDFLNEVASDETLELDCLAYDLNEPDILPLLEKMGPRLRIVIDDSKGRQDGSDETRAEQRLKRSAGADNLRRMHFSRLKQTRC